MPLVSDFENIKFWFLCVGYFRRTGPGVYSHWRHWGKRVFIQCHRLQQSWPWWTCIHWWASQCLLTSKYVHFYYSVLPSFIFFMQDESYVFRLFELQLFLIHLRILNGGTRVPRASSFNGSLPGMMVVHTSRATSWINASVELTNGRLVETQCLSWSELENHTILHVMRRHLKNWHGKGISICTYYTISSQIPSDWPYWGTVVCLPCEGS